MQDYIYQRGSGTVLLHLGNIAEIEIGIICNKALAKLLPDIKSFKNQLEVWVTERNN